MSNLEEPYKIIWDAICARMGNYERKRYDSAAKWHDPILTIAGPINNEKGTQMRVFISFHYSYMEVKFWQRCKMLDGVSHKIDSQGFKETPKIYDYDNPNSFDIDNIINDIIPWLENGIMPNCNINYS